MRRSIKEGRKGSLLKRPSGGGRGNNISHRGRRARRGIKEYSLKRENNGVMEKKKSITPILHYSNIE
jgi:hypothetical protein